MYGPVTPIMAYALSVLGSLLGLLCTARARVAASRASRARWLLLSSWAIGGTGIWVMHFMAMLGFGVAGSEVRYDVPLTAASAVIAIVVVAVGVFIAGFDSSRPNLVKICTGGVVTGLGVASMHYTGMAAMRIDGDVQFDAGLVGASIAIAVVAATVALWFTVTVRRLAAVVASALLMGVAVCGMHYTGMFAMRVEVHGIGEPHGGATVYGLILPIAMLVIFALTGLVYAIMAAPSDEERAEAAHLEGRISAPQVAPPARSPQSPSRFDGFTVRR